MFPAGGGGWAVSVGSFLLSFQSGSRAQWLEARPQTQAAWGQRLSLPLTSSENLGETCPVFALVSSSVKWES